jgi:alpha-tubulin suppressor-like RCC1 family protein
MSQHPKSVLVSILLVFILLGMSLSAMPISNQPIELEEEKTQSMTTAGKHPGHSNLSNFNVAGHQDDSIFTHSTISSGEHTTCIITEDARVACWGKNEQGKRGLGGGIDNSVDEPYGMAGPWLVGNLSSGMVEVSVGAYSTCSLSDGGEIWCWGGGEYGQLGTGNDLCTVASGWSCTEATNHPPQQVALPAGTSAVSLADMGGKHACAILDTGEALCWGNNEDGQLGDGTICSGGDWFQPDSNPSPAGCNAYNGRYIPVIVGQGILPPNSSFISLSTGYYHTCGILDTNDLYCWGNNELGQLGIGTPDGDIADPTFVDNNVVAVGTGGYHTCALYTDKTVSCMGANGYGQLGIGNAILTGWNIPYNINISSNISAISIEIGIHNSCLITDDFTPYCWGRNNWGQASAQQHHFHWGHDDRISPVELWHSDNQQIIPNYTGDWNNSAIAMSINNQAFCSIKMDAILVHGHTDVVCWGANFWGQRGNGSYPDNFYGGINYVNLSSSAIGGAFNMGGLHLSERDLDSDSIISIYDDLPYGCPGGSYDPNFNGSCTQTSPGHYTPGFGHHYEIICDLGTYQPDPGQSNCLESSPGHFVNVTGALTQANCPDGTYQPDYSQVSCIDASQGHTPNFEATSEEPCTFGYYQPDSAQEFCIASSSGSHVPNTGSLTQTECSPGTYQPNFGAAACLSALPGNYVPTSGLTSQEACLPGTYQPNHGQASCLDADPGYFVINSYSTYQTPCNLGTYQNVTASSQESDCLPSDPGHYVDITAATSQIECPAGSYNPNTGSIAASDCILADIGNYVPSPGSSIQTPCDLGYYQPSTGQIFCLESPSGSYVGDTGLSSFTNCMEGFYQPDVVQSECITADAGNYVPISGASSQTPCLAGSYQPETGAVSCILSDIAHHVPLDGQSMQTLCPAGTYQPQPASVECLNTNPGTYSSAGSTSPMPCLAGSYQAQAGQSGCVLADPGYFSIDISSIAQVSCEEGTYQPLTGQESCQSADRGYYVDIPAATEQTPCAAGSYQSLMASTECVLASEGYFVSEVGQASQQSCPNGESQPNVGQISCILDPLESEFPIAVIGGVALVALLGITVLLKQGSKPKARKGRKKSRKMKKR